MRYRFSKKRIKDIFVSIFAMTAVIFLVVMTLSPFGGDFQTQNKSFVHKTNNRPKYWSAPISIGADDNVARGSLDFMSMFNLPNTQWPSASSRIGGLHVGGGWILSRKVTLNDIKKVFRYARAQGMVVATGIGPLNPENAFSENPSFYGQACGRQEGFNRDIWWAVAQKIKDANEQLDYFVMDEPFFYGSANNRQYCDNPHPWFTCIPCSWSMDKVAEQVKEFIDLAHADFPNMIVGLVEPLVLQDIQSLSSGNVSNFQRMFDAFRSKVGSPLPFFRLDVQFDNTDWPRMAKYIENVTKQTNSIPFELITYNGYWPNEDNASYDPTRDNDENWTSRAAQAAIDYSNAGGRPDGISFELWTDRPKYNLPESKRGTFTNFQNAYIDSIENNSTSYLYPLLNLQRPYPMVNILPGNGTMYKTSQSITIRANIRDDVEINSVNFYRNNNLVYSATPTSITGSSSYSYTWNVTNVDNGIYEWKVQVSDSSNRSSTSNVSTLIINIPPLLPNGDFEYAAFGWDTGGTDRYSWVSREEEESNHYAHMFISQNAPGNFYYICSPLTPVPNDVASLTWSGKVRASSAGQLTVDTHYFDATGNGLGGTVYAVINGTTQFRSFSSLATSIQSGAVQTRVCIGKHRSNGERMYIDLDDIKLNDSTSRTLSVAKLGVAGGSVVSNPSGINCGSTCYASYTHGQSVSLSATPPAGTVVSWSGCDSSSGSTCSVAMNANKSVTASFNISADTTSPQVHITSPTSGASYTNAGSITINANASDNVGVNRVEFYKNGSLLSTDTSSPYSSVAWNFTRADNGTYTFYAKAYDSATNNKTSTSIRVTINIPDVPTSYNLNISKIGTGVGTVSSNVGSINCGSACSASYQSGQSVVLKATPNLGSGFVRWSGACSGNGQCTLTMNANKSVTANFIPITRVQLYRRWNPYNTDHFYLTGQMAANSNYTLQTDNIFIYPNGIYGNGNLTDGRVILHKYWTNHGVDGDHFYTIYRNDSAYADYYHYEGPVGWVYNRSGGGRTRLYVYFSQNPRDHFYTIENRGSSTTQDGLSYQLQPEKIWVYSSVSGVSPTHTLTVSKTGSGTISGNGISCGTDCSESYNSGTSVTLTATPLSGYVFTSWGGACAGTGSCSLTMNANKSVSANFSQSAITLTLTSTAATVSLNQSFTVTATPSVSTGIYKVRLKRDGSLVKTCWLLFQSTPTCRVTTYYTTYPTGGQSTWTATAYNSSDNILATQDLVITVLSPTTTYALTVSKTGSGTISGNGISCGTDCNESYNSGTSVTLTATPLSGYVFTSWGGACTGTASCSLTMNANKSVSAIFEQNLAYQKTVSVSNTDTGSSSSYAVDGNISTGWNAGGHPTQWIKIDLGSAYTITGFELIPGQSYINQNGDTITTMFTTNKVYGSATGTDDSWQLIATFSEETTSGDKLVYPAKSPLPSGYLNPTNVSLSSPVNGIRYVKN